MIKAKILYRLYYKTLSQSKHWCRHDSQVHMLVMIFLKNIFLERKY